LSKVATLVKAGDYSRIRREEGNVGSTVLIRR
jgi:hypothetical protein